MAVLAGMVKNVLVIIIMASFLEILLPEGRIRPFVRFAIGLFVIIAVLNPVLNVLFEDRNLQVSLWDYHIAPEQEKEVLERGNSINQQITSTGASNFSDKIEGQISAVVMLVPGVKNVITRASLDGDGGLTHLQLVVSPEKDAVPLEEGDDVRAFSGGEGQPELVDQKQIEEKIRGVINNLYGFSNVKIEIEFEGG